jgi:phage protein D
MAKDLFYSITVDTDDADYDLSDDISALTVDQQEGRPDHLTVELNDPFKVFSHALQEGMGILVDLGTSDDHSVIFRGRIYRVDSSFPQDDVPTLRLEAYDKSMKMGLQKRNRVFTNMALSNVVKLIVDQYNFDIVQVDVNGDPMFSNNGIRQDDETDLGFLLRLARAYGCIPHLSIGATDDTFNFVAEKKVMTSIPAVTLCYGRCDITSPLLSFQSSADISDVQLPRVLSGIDYDSGEVIGVVNADPQSVPTDHDQCFQENLAAFRSAAPIKAANLELLLAASSGVQADLRKELGLNVRQAVRTFVSQSQISALASNQFSTSLHGMRASGAALGVKELSACTNVRIQDVGGRFSRNWYLSQVRHSLNCDGYTTNFECRR